MASTPSEEDINNKLLIEEVRVRPALYNKDLKEYSNMAIKKQLWDEIYSKLFSDIWDLLTQEQKTAAGNVVQKRWKNLRTCFARELRVQNKTEPESKVRRRKYIYYKQLLFLKSFVDHNTSNATNDASSTETPPKKSASTKRNLKRKVNEIYKQSSFEVLNNNSEGHFHTSQHEIDPDVNFALSLVPMLRALPLVQKIDAQIAILNILKEFYQCSEDMQNETRIISMSRSTEYNDIDKDCIYR